MMVLREEGVGGAEGFREEEECVADNLEGGVPLVMSLCCFWFGWAREGDYIRGERERDLGETSCGEERMRTFERRK